MLPHADLTAGVRIGCCGARTAGNAPIALAAHRLFGAVGLRVPHLSKHVAAARAAETALMSYLPNLRRGG